MPFVPVRTPVSMGEFNSIKDSEDCNACIEFDRAVEPTFSKFTVGASDFLGAKVFPPWRTDAAQTRLIGEYECPDAIPISFKELAYNSGLRESLLTKTTYYETCNIVVEHCRSCDLYVVMDGNHRLLEAAHTGRNDSLTVFELSSAHWKRSRIDMRNICDCQAR